MLPNKLIDDINSRVEKGQPIHITPIDDLHTHTEDTTCGCEPKVEEVNGIMLITHNSFDGREAVEEVKEILRKCTKN